MITVNQLGQAAHRVWVGPRQPVSVTTPGMPPPPPTAEDFLNSMAYNQLQYAIGRTRARAYLHLPLAVKEETLRKLSPRRYRSYLSKRTRFLAFAKRVRPAPPRRVVTFAPPPARPPIERIRMVTPAPPGAITRMPPPPPTAEVFLSSLVNTYLQYALGRTRARAYHHLPLAVKEQTLSNASPRHYRSYLRKKDEWLAIAKRALVAPIPPPTYRHIPTRPAVPTPPPVEHVTFVTAPPPIPTRPAVPTPPPVEHVTFVTPAPPLVPTPMPPAPPPAELFLHQLADRYLRYIRGDAFAKRVQHATLSRKEALIRSYSARRYKSYLRYKERFLRVAPR